MMPLVVRVRNAAVVIALALLVGCTRNGPPAPAYVLGEQPGATASAPVKAASPEPAYVAPVRTVSPPSVAEKMPAPESARVEAVKIAPPSEPARAPLLPPASTPPLEAPAKMPPPALVAQQHPPHPDQVLVGKGETLYMIARRYDVPLRSIIDANHLDPPFQVATGTSLTLPQERFHVVKGGDTLYSVARTYGVDVSTLASLNHLSAPYAIRSGDTLYLPAPVAPAEKMALVPPPRPAPVAPPEAPISPAAPAPAEPPPAPKPALAPEQSRAAPSPAEKAHAGPSFAWPLEGRVIESYGTAPSGTHNDGINIAARLGEPVRAAAAGKVAYAGNELRGYGYLVLIKHPGGFMTAYAHNSKLLVKRGEAVARGQEIAKAGATGTVTAPQLHFEIRQGTRALDPTSYLPSLRASAD